MRFVAGAHVCTRNLHLALHPYIHPNSYIYIPYSLTYISSYRIISQSQSAPWWFRQSTIFLLSLDINFPFFSYISFLLYPQFFFAEKKRFRLSLGQSSLFIFIIIIFFLFFVFLSLRFLSSLLNVCHGFTFHVFMILDLWFFLHRRLLFMFHFFFSIFLPFLICSIIHPSSIHPS